MKKITLTRAQLEEKAKSNKELQDAIEGLKYHKEFSMKELKNKFNRSKEILGYECEDFVQFVIEYWERY